MPFARAPLDLAQYEMGFFVPENNFLVECARQAAPAVRNTTSPHRCGIPLTLTREARACLNSPAVQRS